jgi:site-specific DNA-methyltransferase (adenine-specific)
VSSDSHNIFTPFELCDEVVSKIPSLEGNILVVANLEFVYTLIVKGVERERIYFATPCAEKKAFAGRMILESNIFVYNNVITKEDVGDMKFDVVVGNPPYQAEIKTLQNRLWMQFVDAAFTIIKHDGYLAFVTPLNWAIDDKLYARWFADHQPIAINMNECSRHFPGIGITFSYYVIRNSEHTNEDVQFITPTETFNSPLPPCTIGTNPRAASVYTKVLGGSPTLRASAPQTHYSYRKAGKVVDERTDGYPYKVMLSPASSKKDAQWVWGRTICNKQTGPRVVGYTYPGSWKDMVVTSDLQTTHGFIHIQADSMSEAENLKTLLTSKLYMFMVLTRNSIRNIKVGTVRDLPLLDLTRSWTDEELYAHFNLTEEEIALIEDTIKDQEEKPVANAKADNITTGSSSRKGSKMEAARNLLINNGKLVTTSRKEAIAMMVKAGIGKATASTYWQSIKKNN